MLYTHLCFLLTARDFGRAMKAAESAGLPRVRKVRSDLGKKHGTSHSQLVTAAAAYCADKDYIFIKSKTINFGMNRFGSSNPKGFPDALIFAANKCGKFLAVEFKVGADTLKKEQEEWLSRLSKVGFRCARIDTSQWVGWKASNLPSNLPCPPCCRTAVCYNIDDFKMTIVKHIDSPPRFEEAQRIVNERSSGWRCSNCFRLRVNEDSEYDSELS